jgi:Uma2 family endonuclease
MTDQAITSTEVQSGKEYPTYVSAEEYLEKYAHDFFEWDNGELIKMSPASNQHNNLLKYLTSLFGAYFELQPIGMFQIAPFLMQVEKIGLKREPDLLIILNDNPGEFTETAMIGPADICIEIVSEESIERDYGTKFKLYEKAGVKEYWLLDYLRTGVHFYRLNEEGLYIRQPTSDGFYETTLLPGLRIEIATLWAQPLPGPLAIGKAIRAMLGED